MASRATRDIFPPPDVFVRLSKSEIAKYVLRKLCLDQGIVGMHRTNFTSHDSLKDYVSDRDQYNEVAIAIQQGWQELLNQGLIATDPRQGGDWIVITSAGKEADKNWDAMIGIGPKMKLELTDPEMQKEIEPIYIRGDVERAVKEAFTLVEIRVRGAGKYEASDLGTDLMRKAFNPDKGRLTDYDTVRGERVGVSELFAGAIACFKNPGSHRKVAIEPCDAHTFIRLADYLVRFVDQAGRRYAERQPGDVEGDGAEAIS
jgi:uncharacterized protein (TIGR02391 family)